MKAWITYAYKDRVLADNITSVLTSAGIEVLDNIHEIIPGDNIIESIHNTISSADVIFIILSRNSNESDFLNTEIGMIVSEIRNKPFKRIVPIITDMQTNIPPFINQYQYLILKDGEDISIKISELIKMLRSKVHNKPYSNHEKDIILNDLIISKQEILDYEKKMYERKQIQKNRTLFFIMLITLVFIVTILIILMFVGDELLLKNVDRKFTDNLMTTISGMLNGVFLTIFLYWFLKQK